MNINQVSRAKTKAKKKEAFTCLNKYRILDIFLSYYLPFPVQFIHH